MRFHEKVIKIRESSPWGCNFLNYFALKEILWEGQKQQQHLLREHQQIEEQQYDSKQSPSLYSRISYVQRNSVRGLRNSRFSQLSPSNEYEYDDEEGNVGKSSSSLGSLVFDSNITAPPTSAAVQAMIFQLTQAITSEFVLLLYAEIEKIVLFYLKEQGSIAKELATIQESIRNVIILAQSNSDSTTTTTTAATTVIYKESDLFTSITDSISFEERFNSIERQLYNIGIHILKLIQYVDFNVDCIRKIIRKHDHVYPKYKLSPFYFKVHSHNNHDALVLQSQSQVQRQQQNYQIHQSQSYLSVLNYRTWNYIRKRRQQQRSKEDITAVAALGNQILKPLLQEESLGALITLLQSCVNEFYDFQKQYEQQQQQKQEEMAKQLQQNQRSDSGFFPRTSSMDSDSLLNNGSSHSPHRKGHKRSSSTGQIPETVNESTHKNSFASSTSTTSHTSNNNNNDNAPDFNELKGSNHRRAASWRSISLSDHRMQHHHLSLRTRTKYILLQLYSAHHRLMQTTQTSEKVIDCRFQTKDDYMTNDDENNRNQKIMLLNLMKRSDSDLNSDMDTTSRQEEMIELIQQQHHEDLQRQQQRTKRQKISDFLNLMSTFLYMTNYYIVAPSSSQYAKKLGGNPSLASMILGMTSMSALASTLLYSWWTSSSYKPALLFASFCSLFGNILYALGLPYNSLELVLLGRLLNGLGSARAINRRYIADVFSKEDRTAAAASFVTAGALGMATGPAIASILGAFVTPLEYNGTVYWQEENAPGTLMAIAYLVYIVVFIIYFEDPKKHTPPMRKLNLKNTSTSLIKLNVNDTSASMKIQKDLINDENSPLLGTDTKTYNGINRSSALSRSLQQLVSEESKPSNDSIPIWKNVPVLMTFWIYFVLRMCVEFVLSSTSVLSGFYFDWDGTVMGIYLACLALSVLPVNIIIQYFAKAYEDRDLIVVLSFAMVIGCIATIQYSADSKDYTIYQFIIGSMILFVSATALEAPTMSLLSKAIPVSWSKGFFNVGLLATETGTLGRVVSNLLITTVGEQSGLQALLNVTMGIFIGITTISFSSTVYFYKQMEPYDQDD